MTEAAPRPWFQLYLSTAIVAMFATCVLLQLNLYPRERPPFDGACYGWPYDSLRRLSYTHAETLTWNEYQPIFDEAEHLGATHESFSTPPTDPPAPGQVLDLDKQPRFNIEIECNSGLDQKSLAWDVGIGVGIVLALTSACEIIQRRRAIRKGHVPYSP